MIKSKQFIPKGWRRIRLGEICPEYYKVIDLEGGQPASKPYKGHSQGEINDKGDMEQMIRMRPKVR